MQRPGQPAVARCGVVYRLTTRVGLPCLICVLPNGKLLHYANARIDGADKWGRPRWVYNAYKQGQWREVAPYGGQLTENVASALARELLVHAMFALEAAGYPIVFTVHDEIVVEHPTIAKETLERIMSERPAWAEKLGVPVKAKAWVGKRYAKGASPADAAALDLSLDSPFPACVEAQPASIVASVSVVERTPAAQVLSGYTFYEFFAGGAMARIGLGPSWSCLLANDNHYGKARSYAANFGRAGLVVGDIARLTVADLPDHAALAWASFPCPDLSEADQRQGLKGWRSNVVWPFLELMRGLRAEGRAPSTIVLENVVGLVEPGQAEFFTRLCDGLADAGYLFGVVMIDAALFVPQSRERVFIVAVDRALRIPTSIIAPSPSLPFHTEGLVDACERHAKQTPIWWRLPAPPPMNLILADVLEDNPPGGWDPRDGGSPTCAASIISKMTPINLDKLASMRRVGKPVVRSIRYRGRKRAGVRFSEWEVRDDQIANCLLMASGGGSSVQRFLFVDGDVARTRRPTPRETARLMGLPDRYVLPANQTEAWDLTGDGVVVPVVRHLAEHILEPIIGKR